MAKNEDKELEKQQHAKGKLTARERIEKLIDKGTFVEMHELVELQSHHFNLQEKKRSGDGVITGFGKIGCDEKCCL